jgi:hypothetical protein
MTFRMNRSSCVVCMMVLLFLMSLFVVACPTNNGQMTSFSEMTTKDKASFIMSTYSKQYDSYLALYNRGNLTDAEKEVLKSKYDLLGELYPYINLYVGYAEEGAIPPETTEEVLLELINRLVSL